MKRINKQKTPPIVARWLLKKMTVYEEEYLNSDNLLEEFKNILDEKSILYAKMWYWLQVILSFRYYINLRLSWTLFMIVSYLKITFRNLNRNKIQASINILGLACGLTTCFMILIWINDEMSYDRFHNNAEDLYLVWVDTENQQSWTETPGPLANALKNDFPDIYAATRLIHARELLCIYKDKHFIERNIYAVDPDFLKMFSFHLLIGDSETVLADPNSIVLTQTNATKYFGDNNPIGKSINIDNIQSFKVTGVIEDPPHNTMFQFRALIPVTSPIITYEKRIDDWKTPEAHSTYVMLNRVLDEKLVEEKISNVIQHHVAESKDIIRLEPLVELHTDPKIAPVREAINMNYIYLFLTIACFMLLIACINFINLSTANSTSRAKEIGIKKSIGFSKTLLFRQFIFESLIYAILAGIIAIIFITFLLQPFNQISGKELTIQYLFNKELLLLFFTIICAAGILSGIYPALFLTSFKPISILKGKVQGSKSGKRVRKGLVVFQFAISATLIIGTIIINDQTVFMKNQNLGYDKEHIISIPLSIHWEHRENGQFYKAFKSELLNYPNIIGVTQSSHSPADVLTAAGEAQWDGKPADKQALVRWLTVDFDYFETLDIPIVAGRAFSEDYSSDLGTWDRVSFIINEETQRLMGEESAIGKNFELFRKKGPIVGVMKNFNYQSLKSKIEPIAAFILPFFNKTILVKIKPHAVSETVKLVKSTWEKHAGDYPFEFEFVDQQYNQLYYNEDRMVKLTEFFSLLVLMIAGIGLFGLVSHSVAQRTKEFGIRKVLGANFINLLKIINKDFLKWIVLANVIAWPISLMIMKIWLQNYAYRVEISAWIFPFVGFFTLLISLITIGSQVIKSIKQNPIDILKYE